MTQSRAVRDYSSCDLARRWAIHPALARMLIALDTWAAETFAEADPTGRVRWPGLRIYEGYRVEPVAPWTDPTATPAQDSRHLLCPSLAADLRVGFAHASTTDPTVWTFLGRRWTQMGGRWGGDFSVPDWNHFDIDPLRVAASDFVIPSPPLPDDSR